MDIRIYILCILPPLALLSLIPNLKALTPFSAAANVLIITGLGITLYYLVFDMKSMSELRQTPKSLSNLPATFSITVFAMEAIGLVGTFKKHAGNLRKKKSKIVTVQLIENRFVLKNSFTFI